MPTWVVELMVVAQMAGVRCCPAFRFALALHSPLCHREISSSCLPPSPQTSPSIMQTALTSRPAFVAPRATATRAPRVQLVGLAVCGSPAPARQPGAASKQGADLHFAPPPLPLAAAWDGAQFLAQRISAFTVLGSTAGWLPGPWLALSQYLELLSGRSPWGGRAAQAAQAFCTQGPDSLLFIAIYLLPPPPSFPLPCCSVCLPSSRLSSRHSWTASASLAAALPPPRPR